LYQISTIGRRGAEPDPLIRKWFKLYDLPGSKTPVAECQACFKWRKAQNTCRQQSHLLSQCTKYQEITDIDNRSKKFTQTTLDQHVPTIPELKKKQLGYKFALALYTTGKSFTTFDDPTWVDFFKELSYVTPNRHALSGPLLESVYNDTKADVEEIAKDQELGLVTDESTDVSLNRLANYSFLTLDGSSFYWKTKDSKEETQNAAHIVEDAIAVAKEITNRDLSKWISFATDTCSTNQNS